MEKLRATIEQYGRWKELGQYIDRMEGHLESDFSVSVENAKALLESIGKEICSAKSVELAASSSINGVLKAAFLALGYSNENLVNQVSRSLANIGGEIGNLRNEISPTSHGKSLDELRDRNNKVDALTRGFLIDSTLVVAVFLIRAFEERKDAVFLAAPLPSAAWVRPSSPNLSPPSPRRPPSRCLSKSSSPWALPTKRTGGRCEASSTSWTV